MHWINMQSAAGERISNASQLSVFVVWQMFKLFGLLYSLHTQHNTHTQHTHIDRPRFGVLSQIGDECTTANRAEQQIKVVCK